MNSSQAFGDDEGRSLAAVSAAARGVPRFLALGGYALAFVGSGIRTLPDAVPNIHRLMRVLIQ